MPKAIVGTIHQWGTGKQTPNNKEISKTKCHQTVPHKTVDYHIAYYVFPGTVLALSTEAFGKVALGITGRRANLSIHRNPKVQSTEKFNFAYERFFFTTAICSLSAFLRLYSDICQRFQFSSSTVCTPTLLITFIAIASTSCG